ncbi:MAG TPA: ribosome maturation factor RimM [Anaerolineae bacterium]|nr:ribosome maturation factor RimM [Anaerolineae bacterium]
MLHRQPEPRYLAVGRVLRPHGLQGEVRVEILTDSPEHLAELRTVYIGPEHHPYTLLQARVHQNILLLTLKECADRDAAEALRGALVEIAREDAAPLEAEEYYHFQVIGMRVITDTGEALGEVVDVLALPGANDVFVIHGPRGEVLLPAIADVIQTLNFADQMMQVHLLPGLLD